MCPISDVKDQRFDLKALLKSVTFDLCKHLNLECQQVFGNSNIARSRRSQTKIVLVDNSL